MFQAVAIPDHLKTKMRDATREQFMKALTSMEVDTMIEVPDSYYKYATVRAKPLDLSVKNVCSGGTPVGSPESWNIR
jgi:hypothetical protein